MKRVEERCTMPQKGAVKCECESVIKYKQYNLSKKQVTCTVCMRLIPINKHTLVDGA